MSEMVLQRVGTTIVLQQGENTGIARAAALRAEAAQAAVQPILDDMAGDNLVGAVGADLILGDGSAIKQCADNKANIDTLAADLTGDNDIGELADNIDEIVAVGAAVPAIEALAPHAADIQVLGSIIPADTSEQLLVFTDTDGNTLGEVGTDGAWNIALKEIRATNGLEIDPEGLPSIGFAVVDEAENLLFDGSTSTTYASSFNRDRMRRYHYRRRMRLLGSTVQLHIAVFGDSYTQAATRWCRDFATTLIAEMGDAGGGWTGFGWQVGAGPYTHGGTQPNTLNGNIRTGYGLSFNDAWDKAYATAPSPDTANAISSTAGAEITAAFPASPTLSGVDLYWIGTADGVMEYSWNGSSWTSINVQGTVDACSYAALSGFPSGVSGTLYLRVVSGTCKPAGLNWKSAAAGVVVHKLACSGSTYQQLATATAQSSWPSAIAGLSLDAAIVMHGANDQTNARPPSMLAADAKTVTARLKAGIPAIDVLLAMQPENQRTTNPVPMTAYATALAAAATALGVGFLDHQRNFGDPLIPTEYGSGGTTPLFDADLLHPTGTTGGRAFVDGFLRFLNA